MIREIKYIIVKDKQGILRHFKSNWLGHYTIARDNNYEPGEIIEQGIFLDSQLYILECISQEHLIKRPGHYIGNKLNFYQDIRLKQWLKGRELESQLYYNKGIIKEGD
jgi:hypothetical protein